jgi:membrane-bound inhibitor of C-type lysozyme
MNEGDCIATAGLVYTYNTPGGNMNRREIAHLAAALLVTTMAGATKAAAQTTFQTYRCADGTEFIVGFFQYDKRAHMQVDGKAVTLQKRVALTGARYSGGGVTLRTQKSGATLKVGKRKVTACQLT